MVKAPLATPEQIEIGDYAQVRVSSKDHRIQGKGILEIKQWKSQEPSEILVLCSFLEEDSYLTDKRESKCIMLILVKIVKTNTN